MASNLDYVEDIEEAKAYMAKKNVFQLFEVRETMSLCFRTISCTDQLPNTGQTLRSNMSGKIISLEIDIKGVLCLLEYA